MEEFTVNDVENLLKIVKEYNSEKTHFESLILDNEDMNMIQKALEEYVNNHHLPIKCPYCHRKLDKTDIEYGFCQCGCKLEEWKNE